MKKKTKKITAPKSTVFAHGATLPVRFHLSRRGHWPKLFLEFGSTVAAECEYPVQFYCLSEIKKLKNFLASCIAYAESKGVLE